MPVEFKTIEVGPLEIFYREAGLMDAPTILLLHGFPSSSAQYQRLMEYLEADYHVIAPDLPGFGRSSDLSGETTFDRLADAIEAWVEALGLTRFSIYVFDFGAPVGFRLATRHPEWIESIVAQNGNAYEVGLGPKMQGLKAYWADRDAGEAAVRQVLLPATTRSQYLDGVPSPELVNPDLWELDQHYIDKPGRDRIMLDLLYDYRTNVESYPAWHAYLRSERPPLLLLWGANDEFFPLAGARAYLEDQPDAELHEFDSGHFVTATHSDELAIHVDRFLQEHAPVRG